MKTHTRVSIALLAVAVLIGSLTLFKNDEAPHVETASSTSASASPEKQRTSTTTSEKPQTPTASPPVAQATAPQSPAVAGPSSAGSAPSQAAATSAPETRRLVFKTVGKTTGQPLAQGESVARQGKLARHQVQGRVTQIQRPSFAGLKPGDTLTIPVSDRESTQAIVHFVTTPVKGAVSVIGGLEGKRGSFSFESVDGKVQGQLLLLKEEIAFRLEDKGGSDVLWKEVPLGEVMCLPPKASLLTSQMGTKLTVQDSVSGLAPPPAASEPAPIFNSRPAATVQFYLNFNGEIVEGTSWNSQHNAGNAIVAAPAGLTAAQITTVLNEVAEYYRAFDVNVTTDPAKYSAAQLTKRMKCIVTPTNIAADGDANTLGIAYLNKFGTISPDAVCWAFTHDVPTYGIQAIAASAAHEIGHTLSLTHDGTNTAGYYTGHGQGSVQMSPPGFSLLYNDRWGPIMGSPFKLQAYGPPYNAAIRVRADVVQWSKGEYAGANNPQDDVAIIAGKVGYVPDEAGNTRATTTQFPSGNVNQSGIISSETDDDFYIIFTSGGTISMTASPSPNLDIALELQDTAGSVIASSNPSGPVAASVSASVSAGVYFIKVSGSGDMDPATTGYSKYGSIGAYTLTGSIDGWENHPSYEYDLAFTNPSAAGNLVKIGNAEVYSTDLATVTTAEEAYVQFNYANSGWNSIASNGFTFGVTIDGVATPTIRNTAVVPGFGTNNNFSYSLGQLPAGSHQVVVTLDKDGEIPENNETNNVASRWFNVVGAVGTAPDMAPYRKPGWDDRMVISTVTGTNTNASLIDSTHNIYVDFAWRNFGFINTYQSFAIYLKLDGQTKLNWPAQGVLITDESVPDYNSYTDLNLGQLPAGTHTLELIVDVDNAVSESDETNNRYVRTFTVLPVIGTPKVEHQSVSNITPTSAVFFATVTPNGIPTTVSFYVFGKGSFPVTVPVPFDGFSPVNFSLQVTGLTLHQTYGYQTVAQNAFGITYGPLETFTANSAPVATSQSGVTANEDTPKVITVAATDADGDALTYTVQNQPLTGGTVTLSGSTATYTPAPNYSGSDSFQIKVTDGYGGEGFAVISLVVNPVNDAPTLNAIANQSIVESALTQTVPLSGISAGGGESQSITITATSSNTALIPNPTVTYTSPAATGSLSFTPVPNASGSAVITVTVQDDGGTANGGVDTLVRTFTVTVSGVNKAPSFALPASQNPPGVNWTARPSGLADQKLPYGIASSADGTKLAVVASLDQIYTSTDSGQSWTARDSSRGWRAIASSADGTKLVAAVQYGPFYTSTNSGVSWTAQTNEPRGWVAIASSADGTKLAAVESFGFGLFRSANSGATWTYWGDTDTHNWTDIASSADGTKLAATTSDGIYISNDSGATFILRGGSRNWTAIASSSDGTKLAAVVSGGQIYTSTDSGVTWTARESSRSWRDITSSADGSKLAAIVNGGQIYISTDSGATWTARETDRSWLAITSSADGFKLAATSSNSAQIFTSTATPYDLINAANSGPVSIPGFVTSISPGPANESSQTVSFVVTNSNNALFTTQPAISPNGTLTFATGPTSGTATVTVVARDNGGTAYGGIDTSVAQTFTITTSNPPTISDITNKSTNANTPTSAIPFTVSDPDVGDTLTVTASSSNTTLLPNGNIVLGGSGANRTITLTPLPNRTGTTTITVQVSDGLIIASDTFVLTVNAAPVVAVDGTAVFTAASSLATARSGHTATLLANGKVLVVGGDNGSALASAEIYDPAANTWSAAGSLATARGRHTATLLSNGKVLVTGGYNVTFDVIASAEIYDPVANTWSAAGSLATPRWLHTATLLANGKVLVTGGSWSFDSGSVLASAEIYDPATNTWSAAASLAVERFSHTATLLDNGKVLVTGGSNSGGYIARTDLYDPAANTWSTVGSLTTGRASHTATLLANGKVLVVGGSTGSYLASAEIFDPAVNSWSAAGSLTSGRDSHTATLLANGKVLVVGGYGSTGILASSELYNPATNAWPSASSLPAARQNHTATLLANGKVLVAGGYNGSNILTGVQIYGVPPVVKTAAEGTAVSQTGTFSDADGNATVTLTASSGTITKNSVAGTWNWTATGSDGPSTTTVTITATDTENATATAAFTFTVTNVAPTFSLGSNVSLPAGSGALSSTVAFTDPGADVWSGTVNYGDGSGPVTLSVDQSAKTFALSHTYTVYGTYTVSVTLNDDDGGTATRSYTVTAPVNRAPTDITLSASSIAENNVANATVGTFTTTDPDAGNTFTYSFASGGADNASFTIAGNALKISPSADFEAKSSYAIKIRSTDDGGLPFEKSFTISITNVNELPSFTKGANQTHTAGTTSPQAITGWATGIDDGDSTVTQALTFNVSHNNAALFSVAPAVSSAGDLTYSLTGTIGTATVTVSLTDDASINGTAALTSAAQTFTITVQGNPDINVQGNGISIADGDLTPSSSDHTDFGSVATVSGSIVRTFTIQNTGNAALTIGAGAITLGGSAAADFTVGGITLPTSVAAGASTTFTVTFDPSASGVRTATVSIASNDPDAENPYTFDVQGSGIPAPAITSISPSSGSTAGGTSVTITGTGFTGATGATVGGVALTGFSVVNDTTITGTTGAHAVGAVNVAVTGSPNGASTGGTSLFTYLGANALQFDGLDDYVAVNAGMPVTMPECTFEFWFKPTNQSGVQSVLSYDTWEPGALHFITIGGTLRWAVNGCTPSDTDLSSFTFTAGTWYHVAIVYSASAKTLKWYVDGTLRQTNTYSAATPLAAAKPFRIGSWLSSRYLNAALDEMRIWSTTRLGTQIAALKDTEVTDFPSELKINYQFNSGTANGTNTGINTAFDAATSTVENGSLGAFNLIGTASNWVPGRALVPVSLASSPVVASPASTSIGSTTATAGGDVTSDGGATIVERGVVIAATSDNSNPTVGGAGSTVWPASGGTTGVFTVPLSALSLGTDFSFRAYAANAGRISYSSTATFTTLNAPDLAVKLSGMKVNDDGAADFGVVQTAQTKTLTFALSNPGSSALNIAGVSIDGVDAALFSADSPSASSIAAGGSATLSVTYTPNASALASAVLHIASNVTGAKSSYDITLQGEGAQDVLLTETFDTVTGNNFQGGQRDSTQTVGFGMNLDGWDEHNSGTLHVVDLANTGSSTTNPRNLAGMFFYDNVIEQTTAMTGSNLAGVIYVVRYLYSPAVYQDPSQKTQAGDGVKIEVLRSNTPIPTVTATPGAWSGYPGMVMGRFTYTGDGNGDVKLRVSSYPSSALRFGGAIDNLQVARLSSPAPAPTITNITPASGSTTGGTAVTITGTGFTGSTGATIGGVALTAFSVVNDTTITGTTGAHAAAVADVVITGSPGGPSTGGVGIYTYAVPPGPEISLTGNGVNIVDGDTTPDVADHTDFGSTSLATGTVVRTFTVSNTGTTVLSLTGTPRVAISGANAADFTVTLQPASTVAATSGFTTFQVTFAPSVAGLRAATVTIANDDSDENPFDFAIQGIGSATIPTVTLPTIANVTTTTATLGGTVTSDGGAEVFGRGIVYSKTSENSNPVLAGPNVTPVGFFGGTGQFAVLVQFLSPGTSYTFKAWATNSQGTSYSIAATFTTVGAPTVASPTSTAITNISATLGGEVTSDGGAAITERGVICAPTFTNPNPTYNGPGIIKFTASGFNGIFTVGATGLNPSTSYSFRAYAINSVGVSYSDVASFYTLPNPLVQTWGTSNVTATTASLSGHVDYDIIAQSQLPLTERGVVYSPAFLNSNPAIGGPGATNRAVATTFATFAVNVTDLSPGTHYIWRAYVINSTGTYYSLPASFFTLALAPTVMAEPAAYITLSGALLGGMVTNDGGGLITERGAVVAPTSVNPNPVITDVNVTKFPVPGGPGGFVTTASGLLPGTNYTFKTYATNSGGTGYSTARTFTTSPDTNADLSGLALSGASLSPAFSSSTLSYTAQVPYSTTSLPFTATKASSYATLNSPASPLSLVVGSNNLAISVVAQDGVTTKTYTVIVTRETETLSNWSNDNFGNNTTNTALAEDFDGDGVPNMMEFAFGMNPAASSNPILSYSGDFSTVGTVVPTGEPIVGTQNTGPSTTIHWALYARRKDYVAAGLVYTVAFSADLMSWEVSTAVPTLLADDGINQLMGVPYPASLSGGQTPLFFRVRVSLQP